MKAWAIVCAISFGLPISTQAAGGLRNPVNRICGSVMRMLSKFSGIKIDEGKKSEEPMKQRNPIKKIEDLKTLLVIVAMPVEYEAIKKEVQSEKVHTLHSELGIELLETNIGDRKILIGKSGVGLVNGALISVLADQKFKLDGILLLGVGGSLDNKLEVGDLVISNRIIQHDAVFSGADESLMAPGELFLSVKNPEDRVSPKMPSNEVLRDFLVETAKKKGHRAFVGTVLSGNEFAARLDRKQKLAGLDDQALLVDMEAAGIAQVARKLNVPMAAAKTVADRFNPADQIADDYKNFVGAASEHAGDIFREILKHFKESK